MSYLENFKLYLSSGVGDVNRIQEAIDNGAKINSIGMIGGAALMCAARNGHVMAVQFLLGCGANPNWYGRSDNEIVLSVAQRNNHMKVARLLAPFTAIDDSKNTF